MFHTKKTTLWQKFFLDSEAFFANLERRFIYGNGALWNLLDGKGRLIAHWLRLYLISRSFENLQVVKREFINQFQSMERREFLNYGLKYLGVIDETFVKSRNPDRWSGKLRTTQSGRLGTVKLLKLNPSFRLSWSAGKLQKLVIHSHCLDFLVSITLPIILPNLMPNNLKNSRHESEMERGRFVFFQDDETDFLRQVLSILPDFRSMTLSVPYHSLLHELQNPCTQRRKKWNPGLLSCRLLRLPGSSSIPRELSIFPPV